MRLLLIVLLLISPAFVYAAPPAFVATWKLDAVRTKDGPVPKDKLAGGGMTWQFKADGTLAMTIWKGDQSVTANATWTLAKGLITIDENGKKQVVKFRRRGAKLDIIGTGSSTVVMTFVKTK